MEAAYNLAGLLTGWLLEWQHFRSQSTHYSTLPGRMRTEILTSSVRRSSAQNSTFAKSTPELELRSGTELSVGQARPPGFNEVEVRVLEPTICTSLRFR